MRIPDFFIVGAPKCGTTALYSYLRQHPAVFMPERKEPRFFATDLDSGSKRDARYFVRGREAYLRLFAPAGSAARVGEATALYLYSTAAARNIKQFRGDARIIAMLRNPVELMYAFHSERLYNGNEEIDDFAEALDAEPERKQGRRIPSGCFIPQALWYREVATLSPQIERFLAVFGRKDVMFIVHDDLKADTPAVYRDVLRFLELDDVFNPDFRVVNANRQVRSKWLRNALRYPSEGVLRTVRALVPHTVRRRLLHEIRSRNVAELARPPMDPILRQRLQKEFAPEVERLGRLIGRDLAAWSRAPAVGTRMA